MRKKSNNFTRNVIILPQKWIFSFCRFLVLTSRYENQNWRYIVVKSWSRELVLHSSTWKQIKFTQDLWFQLNNLEFYLQAKVQRKVWKSPQEVKLGASEGCIEANQNHSAVTKTATKLRLTRTDFTSPHIKTVIRSVFCIENCLDICF